jgi:uncharacterized protein
MKKLNLVLKTVERCNLNCSYCYFFNGLDQSYLKRPKFISRETIDSLVLFLLDAVNNYQVTHISIGFHGGEPLMQPKEDFIYIVESINQSLPIPVNFTLQTNATLISKKWIQLFNKYKIGLGISIDGTKETHDTYRVDHYGNGSYDSVIKGIKLLKEELDGAFGSLVVVNPVSDPKILLQHLIDLGFESSDFLLPDNNYINPPKYDILEYTKFMIGLFDSWVQDDNSNMTIRKFKSMMLQLVGENSMVYGFGKKKKNKLDSSMPIISIRSDGEICTTDELMSTDPKTVTNTGCNIKSSKISDVLGHPIFTELEKAMTIPAEKCSKCLWYNACGGGNLVSRFSKENRFNNPSIYCDMFKGLFEHITKYLLQNGVTSQEIKNALFEQS